MELERLEAFKAAKQVDYVNAWRGKTAYETDIKKMVYLKAFEFSSISKEVYEKAMTFETKTSVRKKLNTKLMRDEINKVILET